MTTLTDVKIEQMVTSVQDFISRSLIGDTIIGLTFDQLVKILDVTAQDMKADASAIVRLQESLMAVGISFISLPTIFKAEDQKAKKIYYLFRDSHSAFATALTYTDEEFEVQLRDRSTTFFDIKNLERLNLTQVKLAGIVCDSIGHSRLSTSKHGKCARCGRELKNKDFTVVVSQEGKIGTNRETFRPIDRLDWRDLAYIPERWIRYLSKSKKFDKVICVENCHGLIQKVPEELTDDQKAEVFKAVMTKKNKRAN